METQRSTLTIVTRSSPLAVWQATFVKNQLLQRHPHLKINIVKCLTQGDKIKNLPVGTLSSKDWFVKDLQQQVLAGSAHMAVHSIKDRSVQEIPELVIAAFCTREDARDVFISPHGPWRDLPEDAVIGTSSPRRHCQLKAGLPKLNIQPIRGNIGTRLALLDSGKYTGLVLAAAALKRLNYSHRIQDYFDPSLLIPAIGQGAIGVECRSEDAATQALLEAIDDNDTRVCVTAERAVNRQLGGDCFTPMAAYAVLKENEIYLSAMVGNLDGTCILRSAVHGPRSQAEALGLQAGEQLVQQGARELLALKGTSQNPI